MEEHGANFPEPPPDLIDGEEQYEVEQVLGTKKLRRKLHFFIKWKGYSAAHNTWEPKENVNAPELVKEFYQKNPSAIREMVFEGGERDATDDMTFPPGPSPPNHFTRLSSTITNNAEGQEGIEAVLDGTAPSVALWYDDSSPYTSQETRIAALATTYDDFVRDPIPRVPLTDANPAAAAQNPEETPRARSPSLAHDQPGQGRDGAGGAVPERTPAGHGDDPAGPPHSDRGADNALGGADWGGDGEDSGDEGLEGPEGVDQWPSGLEEDPWMRYSAHDHDAGDSLFPDISDPTFD
jgi:Chromo (CHRromatin Organisation MOdifier) domain